jgi:hypothetical protein
LWVALETAIATSVPFQTPIPIFPPLSPTSTVALNLILLQPVVTFVTFLTSKRDSSNHCNFDIRKIDNNKDKKHIDKREDIYYTVIHHSLIPSQRDFTLP